MTSQTTLQDIVKKIRALRARAADSASSENEAAMAAKVADELLERHNINLSEVDVRADGVVKERWDSFQKTEEFWRQRERGQSARKIGFSFRKGVAMRIGERIGKFAESVERVRSSSNALVPVKNALVAAYLDENNIKINSASSSPVDTAALYAGMKAGEKVALGRGIATSRPVAMIAA